MVNFVYFLIKLNLLFPLVIYMYIKIRIQYFNACAFGGCFLIIILSVKKSVSIYDRIFIYKTLIHHNIPIFPVLYISLMPYL